MRVNDQTATTPTLAEDHVNNKFNDSNNNQALWVNGSGKFSGDIISENLTASGDITAGSDRRLKDDIQPLTSSLEKVKKLQGVSYTRNDLVCNDRRIGLVAQDGEEVIPEVVSTSQLEMKDNKSISYGNLVAVLVEAIKEQQAQIDDLKSKLA